ncbi:hypothetical protein EYF80_064894 [Liparis tanakae]|uniref:Uncharacterized protein n=1 Tax=Liparis tanakae TaxID=230148 RepID=A0A4Z2E859_9TELE|nr:hypothetical protein EYF80_064894 [Liparis tanakae]
MENASTSAALPRLNPNLIKSLLQDPFQRRTLAEKLQVKQLGPDQPPELNIKQQTGVKGKQHMRSFCKDWYTRKAWLAGCSHANAVFCFPCVLFKSTGSGKKTREHQDAHGQLCEASHIRQSKHRYTARRRTQDFGQDTQ